MIGDLLGKGLSFLGGKLTGALDKGTSGFMENAVNKGFDGILSRVFPEPGPMSGAALGTQARNFFDKAYPGTNPWERLGGSGSPAPAIAASRESARAARHVVQKTTDTSKDVAKIAARGQAVAAAVNAGDPDRAKEFGDYAAGDVNRIRPGRSAAGVTADAARMNAFTNRRLSRIRDLEVRGKVANLLDNPAAAALKSVALQAFEEGRFKPQWRARVSKAFEALVATGAAPELVSRAASALGLSAVAAFPVSVKPWFDKLMK